MSKTNVRYVDIHGVRYLRAEDVEAYLRELAATETTDTRLRIEEGARLLRGTPVAIPSAERINSPTTRSRK